MFETIKEAIRVLGYAAIGAAILWVILISIVVLSC